MPPAIEARVVEMRRQHPGWAPRTILSRLVRAGVTPLPSRFRDLPRARPSLARRSEGTAEEASDYKRWERSRAMELWQMDVTLGMRLQDGTSPSIVTGIDDRSRYCVSAKVVARATARPVCDACSSMATMRIESSGFSNKLEPPLHEGEPLAVPVGIGLVDHLGNKFKNHGDCVSYVATGGKNVGAIAP